VHDQDLTEAIRQRAYEIWLSEGRPHGRDRIHWLRAEAECREMFNAEHSGSGCKAGLHEKPIEPRIKKRRTRKADRTPKQSKPSG
jgi:hypothetical protein